MAWADVAHFLVAYVFVTFSADIHDFAKVDLGALSAIKPRTEKSTPVKAESTNLSGHAVTIRPICKTDVALEAAFIRKLSPQTKHYRFFGGVRELSAIETKHLCDMDGVKSMAFVATVQDADGQIEIGVCRYAPDSKADVREIAVTISDEWQHKGLGKLLMQHLISSAKQNGVRQLYSVELADNTMMRQLAGEIGMSACRDPSDAHQVVYSLPL